MKKDSIYILILVFFFSIKSFGQDIHFAQFLQTPQLINPAAAGIFDGKIRGILNYRSQWGAFGGAYKTYAASFDMPLSKRHRGGSYFGLGANFYKDAAGSSNFGNFIGSVSASGVLLIQENQTLSVGLQGGFGQYSVNLSDLTWGSQFNGSEFDLDLNSDELFSAKSSNYIDAGAGIYYRVKKSSSNFLGSEMSSFNIGIAGYHLNKPKQKLLSNTESVIPMKFVAQFSGTFDISGSKVALQPSMFYAIQGPFTEITPGMLVKLKYGASTKYTGFFKQAAFYFGIHYRVKDAILPQVYFEFTDYMIGVSYDYNISDLSSATGGNGGFEISLRYINRSKAIQRGAFK